MLASPSLPSRLPWLGPWDLAASGVSGRALAQEAEFHSGLGASALAAQLGPFSGSENSVSLLAWESVRKHGSLGSRAFF